MAIDERAIQGLIDREAIRSVLLAYADAIDTWNIDAFPAVFTDDVYAIYNYNELDGIENLKNYFKNLSFRGPLGVNALPTRMHFTGNVTIDLDGDTAQSDTYLLALNSTDDGRMLVRGNRYFDAFVRMPEGWRIRDRRHKTEWMFDSPVRMDPDRPSAPA